MVSGLSRSFDVEQQQQSLAPEASKSWRRAFGMGIMSGAVASLLALVAIHQVRVAPSQGQNTNAAVMASADYDMQTKQMAMKMMLSQPAFQQEVERTAAELDAKMANPEFRNQAEALARRMKQVLADPGFKGQAELPSEVREAQVAQQRSLQALLQQRNPESAFAFSGPAGGSRMPATKLRPAASTKRAALNMQAANVSAVSEAPAPAAPAAPKFDVKDLAGITAPLGFFDPVGFTTDETEGKIRFYREVEIKHGRVGMLASVGFLVGENFHPLFGGNIDVPAYLAFQQTPLQTFWPAVVFVIAVLEIFSVFTFQSPFGGQPWTIKADHVPGDLGFDPLGLKPTDPKELKEMQTKELNNGRLAMLAAAGMIAQELATGQKLF